MTHLDYSFFQKPWAVAVVIFLAAVVIGLPAYGIFSRLNRRDRRQRRRNTKYFISPPILQQGDSFESPPSMHDSSVGNIAWGTRGHPVIDDDQGNISDEPYVLSNEQVGRRDIAGIGAGGAYTGPFSDIFASRPTPPYLASERVNPRIGTTSPFMSDESDGEQDVDTFTEISPPPQVYAGKYNRPSPLSGMNWTPLRSTSSRIHTAASSDRSATLSEHDDDPKPESPSSPKDIRGGAFLHRTLFNVSFNTYPGDHTGLFVLPQRYRHDVEMKARLSDDVYEGLLL